MALENGRLVFDGVQMNPIFTFIASLFSSFADDWKAKRQNQRDIEKAVAENKIRLAQSIETHNQAWEMAALEGRDNTLRRLSFVMWSSPILWAAIDAKGAEAFFRDALGALPEWYVWGYLAISGAVWGISELKAVGGMRK